MGEYVKIRSWHRIRTATRMFNTYITLCGRTATGRTLGEFPSDEKTCETCLRIEASRETGET